MNSLIKQYINKININNINDFALKNNIILDKNELNIIYDVVKNHHEKILNDDQDIFDYVKENISSDNYEKIIQLLNEYKEKFKGYLWWLSISLIKFLFIFLFLIISISSL